MKIEYDQLELELALSFDIITSGLHQLHIWNFMTLIIIAIKPTFNTSRSQRFYSKLIHSVSEACTPHDPLTTDLINSANVPGFQLNQDISQLLYDYNNAVTIMMADDCNYVLLKHKQHYIMKFDRSVTNMFDLPANGSCVFVLFHEYTTTTMTKQLLNSNVTLDPLDPPQVQALSPWHDSNQDDTDPVQAYVGFSRFKYVIKTTDQFQYLNIPMQKNTILDQFNSVDKAFVMLQDPKYMKFIRQHVSIHEFKVVLDRAWKYMLQLEHHHKIVHLFDLDCVKGLPLFNMCTDTIASTNTNPYVQVRDGVAVKQSDRQLDMTCNNMICSSATFAKRFKSFLGDESYDKLIAWVDSNPNVYVTGGIMSLLLNQDQVDASQYDNSDIDVLCVHRAGHEFVESVKRFMGHAIGCGNLESEFNVTITCTTDVEMPYSNLTGIKVMNCSGIKLKGSTNLHEWFTCAANPTFVHNEHNHKQLQKIMQHLGRKVKFDGSCDDMMLQIVQAIINHSKTNSSLECFEKTIHHLNIVFVKSDQLDTFNIMYHPKIKLTSFGPHKRKVEFFHINSISPNTTTTAANLISSFHLPCVRAYYNIGKEGKGKIMMTASAVSAYMTNINFNIMIHDNMTTDDDKNQIIIDKYHRRGYTNVLMSNKNT
ncbi:Hypothetical protein MVR_LOCUS339 [uncultured virus]|nr:Hypothetical protein MVR_LOCUS339 [uncultured virus]